MRISARKAPALPKAQRTAKPAAARPRTASTDGFAAQSPRAMHDLAVLLESASKVRRAASEVGKEALLTPREEARARFAFAHVPKEVAAELNGLLAMHKGSAANVAHALLFKAIAARADVLPAETARAALKTFSQQLLALDPETMLERASVLDLAPDKNTSHLNAQALWDKQGTVVSRSAGDTAADNDGLIQRFTASCGPTTLQMMLAEADPILAFAINHSGRASPSTRGGAADFQRAMLEEYGGIAVGRAESYLASRVHNAFAQLVRSGAVTAKQRDAALAFLKGGEQKDGTAEGLEACRQRYGFPTEAEVAQLRAALIPPRDEGLGFEQFIEMLNAQARSVIGKGFKQTAPADGFPRGGAAKHLDDVEKALKAGFDVPLGTVEPAHWMLLTAVKHDDGGRMFLMSDPDAGRTAWVSEKDLVSGKALDAQFHLNKPSEKPYIDSFFLPA
jgi:hypothetical protein